MSFKFFTEENDKREYKLPDEAITNLTLMGYSFDSAGEQQIELDVGDLSMCLDQLHEQEVEAIELEKFVEQCEKQELSNVEIITMQPLQMYQYPIHWMDLKPVARKKIEKTFNVHDIKDVTDQKGILTIIYKEM